MSGKGRSCTYAGKRKYFHNCQEIKEMVQMSGTGRISTNVGKWINYYQRYRDEKFMQVSRTEIKRFISTINLYRCCGMKIMLVKRNGKICTNGKEGDIEQMNKSNSHWRREK